MKQRSKLTKIFFKNGLRKRDQIKVLEKSTKCTKKIIEANNSYVFKMTTKLEDSNTAPKQIGQYYHNCLLYNKKVPAISPLLVDGSFISDYFQNGKPF